MTMMSQAATQTAIPAPTGGWGRPFNVLMLALLSYWERRVAIKVLRQLDDRALRDIGIGRGQIEAAVGGALDIAIARLH